VSAHKQKKKSGPCKRNRRGGGVNKRGPQEQTKEKNLLEDEEVSSATRCIRESQTTIPRSAAFRDVTFI